MRLRSRPGRAADVEEGWSGSGDDTVRSRTLGLWRHVLETGGGEAVVLEDEDGPLGFGLSVFTGPSPLPSPEDSSWGDGRGGLSVRALHGVARGRTLRADERDRVSQRMVEALVAVHRGYPMREFTLEVYEDRDRDAGTRMGLRLCTDEPSPPYLLRISREEALAAPGTLACALFSSEPPRFQLTPGERELAVYALQGDTDPVLARQLGVEVTTVKKRWAGMYLRVGAVDPELVRPPGSSRTRGAEKRRRLLAYLREHPEELRPRTGVSR